MPTPPQGERDGIVAAVDIGGTKTALVVWDQRAERILLDISAATPTDLGPQAFTDGLVEEIHALIARARRSESELIGIGVAVPGLVDERAGLVLEAGNLAGWVDLPLRATLEEHFPVAVAIEQDANAAALGEQWRGAAQGESDFVFLALGTGVGAGIMLNGQLHRGAHHAAGEVGNFVVGREFLGQERGGQGNLAQLIGGRTLRARAEAATGVEISAARAIAASDHDAGLARIAEDVIDYLAMSVIAIASLLDPPLIVIGGGTAAAGHDLFEPVRARVAPELARATRIVPAALGPEAQLYGAVRCALVRADAG
ncbi:MAG: ROK family protein [Thermomicrobiales bacterium]|nr:ROK family protein [Thermomicrobiales bacterium]